MQMKSQDLRASLSLLSPPPLGERNLRFAPGEAAWFFFSLGGPLSGGVDFKSQKATVRGREGVRWRRCKVPRAPGGRSFFSRQRQRCVVGVFFLSPAAAFFCSRRRGRQKGARFTPSGTPRSSSNSSSRERSRSLRAAYGEKKEVGGREGRRGEGGGV